MKNLLTRDINRRTHMSYASRQRCSEGRAAQSGSYPPGRARATTRGCRTPGPGLGGLQAPSLSLSSAGSATQASDSRGRCQGLLYRQTLASSGGYAPDVRRLNRLDLERDRQSSVAGIAASWGRPWLTARQVGNGRCGWNFNLTGCGRRNWPRLMNAWCPTGCGSATGQLPHYPEATRRF